MRLFIAEKPSVATANDGALIIAGGKEAAPVSSLHTCMVCGSDLSRRPSKKQGHFGWGRSRFPTGKPIYPDLKGRPNTIKGRRGKNSDKA